MAVGPADAAGLNRIDTSTLHGKFVVGFQGWFMCPGDGRPGGGWWHWFTANRPDPEHVHFDLLPDTHELSASEKCATDLVTADGRKIKLFSDQNPQTVLRQFIWMQTYGIQTVALQRFVTGIDPVHPVDGPGADDRVLDNVRRAAEKTGRGFYVMYDIAGAKPDTWSRVLLQDWKRLLNGGLTRSSNYQRHNGRPVLAIAGVGSDDRPGNALEMAQLFQSLRAESAPYGGITLVGSVATGWRTLDGDAKTDPAWSAVYRSLDIISPWTVGRYRDSDSFDVFKLRRLAPDIEAARQAGVEYMPVIFPGFSWHNLSHSSSRKDASLDAIPRQCGKFLRLQATADTKSGATMVYGAMFDEVDEGTALFKMVTDPADLPLMPPMKALNDKDCHVESDFYLKLSGNIQSILIGKAANHSGESSKN
jgi:hypothetical protein